MEMNKANMLSDSELSEVAGGNAIQAPRFNGGDYVYVGHEYNGDRTIDIYGTIQSLTWDGAQWKYLIKGNGYDSGTPITEWEAEEWEISKIG